MEEIDGLTQPYHILPPMTPANYIINFDAKGDFHHERARQLIPFEKVRQKIAVLSDEDTAGASCTRPNIHESQERVDGANIVLRLNMPPYSGEYELALLAKGKHATDQQWTEAIFEAFRSLPCNSQFTEGLRNKESAGLDVAKVLQRIWQLAQGRGAPHSSSWTSPGRHVGVQKWRSVFFSAPPCTAEPIPINEDFLSQEQLLPTRQSEHWKILMAFEARGQDGRYAYSPSPVHRPRQRFGRFRALRAQAYERLSPCGSTCLPPSVSALRGAVASPQRLLPIGGASVSRSVGTGRGLRHWHGKAADRSTIAFSAAFHDALAFGRSVPPPRPDRNTLTTQKLPGQDLLQPAPCPDVGNDKLVLCLIKWSAA